MELLRLRDLRTTAGAPQQRSPDLPSRHDSVITLDAVCTDSAADAFGAHHLNLWWVRALDAAVEAAITGKNFETALSYGVQNLEGMRYGNAVWCQK